MKKLLSMFMGLTLALASLLVVTPGALAAIVGTNGSFELGTDPGVFSNLLTGDSASVTDWTVNAGSLDYIGTYWQAADGARSIDLNGSSAGSISQTLVTVPGATYVVHFSLSGNPDVGPSAKVLRVSATSGTPASQDFTYDTSVKGNTLADMKWESNTYTFVASSTSTTLTFGSQVEGAAGPALDKISVEETLPPVTHVLAVAKAGNGAGTVTSVPSGINCGADCSKSFDNDTAVTLTATAAAGSSFTGWSGDCSGTGSCALVMSSNESVTATFTLDVVVPVTFTIRALAGSHGSISPSGSVVVNSGSNQAFTITADSGFHVKNVWVDGSSVGAVGTFTFSNVLANHRIVASFTADSVSGLPQAKADCKEGGWAGFSNPSFRNQGLCVAQVNHQFRGDDDDDEDSNIEDGDDSDDEDEDDDDDRVSANVSANVHAGKAHLNAKGKFKIND
ncbi:MAG: choice-of-anchor C family protein [Patescibacteria group bacterium]